MKEFRILNISNSRRICIHLLIFKINFTSLSFSLVSILLNRIVPNIDERKRLSKRRIKWVNVNVVYARDSGFSLECGLPQV